MGEEGEGYGERRRRTEKGTGEEGEGRERGVGWERKEGRECLKFIIKLLFTIHSIRHPHHNHVTSGSYPIVPPWAPAPVHPYREHHGYLQHQYHQQLHSVSSVSVATSTLSEGGPQWLGQLHHWPPRSSPGPVNSGPIHKDRECSLCTLTSSSPRICFEVSLSNSLYSLPTALTFIPRPTPLGVRLQDPTRSENQPQTSIGLVPRLVLCTTYTFLAIVPNSRIAQTLTRRESDWRQLCLNSRIAQTLTRRDSDWRLPACMLLKAFGQPVQEQVVT